MSSDYCPSRHRTVRRLTRVVNVGGVAVGGLNPLRLQSMTTSDTEDVAATLAQAIRLAEAGCEIIRITAPNKAAAIALKDIHQQFRAAGGPPALLATLKQQGLVLDLAECVMAKVADQPAPAGWSAWQVVPTGKLKQDFDAQVQIEIPEPPCGKLGYAVDSVGFFMVKDDAPDRVLYANLGQDGTMIDLASIRLK